MSEPHDLPLAHMHLDEIEELLLEMGADLSPAALRETALFMQQVGSIEAALAALSHVERKAA